MNLAELIEKKRLLLEQITELEGELSGNKKAALEEIRVYVKELGISFIEMEKLYREEKLSTALVQEIKERRTYQKHGSIDRSKYPYHDAVHNRWYNGYNNIPYWFDLDKADSYLLPGRKHSKLVRETLEKRGLNRESQVMAKAFTIAQIKSFKERADQFDKLFTAKNFDLIDHNKILYRNDLEHIIQYCADDVAEYLSK